MRSRQVPLFLILLLACAVAAAPLAATTWFVDAANTTGVEDGTEAHPYRTIGRALLGAFAEDVVLVRPGLYEENISIPAGIIVMGQCATAVDCDPNDVCARRRASLDPNNASIIDGLSLGPSVSISAALSTTVLDGFTITGGRSLAGGGISIFGNPTVCNNTISGNVAVGGPTVGSVGGGIYVIGNAVIQDNLVFGNTAVTGQGGGIAVDGGAPVITRNEIRGNSALAGADGFFGYGGGIATTAGAGAAAITSNVITGNRADQGGGGIDVYRSLPTIAGNTIDGNRAGHEGRKIGHGGGIAVTGQRGLPESTTPIIMNNLILRNEASVSGGGLDVIFARPHLAANNLFGNTPVNFRGKQAPASADGNLSIDPNLPSPLSMPGPGYPHVDAGHDGLFDVDEDLSADPNVIGDRRIRRRGVIGPLDFFHRPRALDGDSDGAGRSDLGAAELVPGSDPGLPGVDPNGLDLDDLDGDGHLDADPNSDNCPAIYNLAQVDTDSDGDGDPCDNCPTRRNGACDADPNAPDYDPALDPLCDTDLDGTVTQEERERGRQRDSDGDLVGDPCDADLDGDSVLEDFDGDGIAGGLVGTGACVGKQRARCDDNCPVDFNETQRDRDRDGLGDICDNCDFRRNGFCGADPGAPGYDPALDRFCDVNRNGITTDEERALGRQLDTDGDLVGDACDNCPTVPNGNCLGGVETCDSDGDGVLSSQELIRGSQADKDDDRIGDACEVDLDNDKVPCRLVDLSTMDPNAPAGRQIVVCDSPCFGGALTGCDDNCPGNKNATQTDGDADGVGDTCDNCDTARNGPCDEDADPNSPGRDPSKDPFCDLDLDGTVTDAEREEGRQLNTDSDAEGNVCDTDDDGDGALDDGESPPSGVVGDNPCPGVDPNMPADGCDDNCRVNSNAGQTDTDEDGEGNACDEDADGDGVPTDVDPNSLTPERCTGGATTGCDDNCAGDPNPGQEDADGDTHGDACDNCPAIANIFQENRDVFVDPNNLDELGDACDPDPDGDEDPNIPIVDNCPELYNATQEDADADLIGDECDNCPDDYNPGQGDNDGDRLGDPCDNDDDGDTIRDGRDNCPLAANPLQTDLDKDGTGDSCDPDLDGDGVPDGSDNCPRAPNPPPADLDSDGDGLGDLCDLCPSLASPVNTDGDRDGLGDPCDFPKIQATLIEGPASAVLGGGPVPYLVTFTNLSPWTGAADYAVRLVDPTGASTPLAGVTGAAIAASGTLVVGVSASFPAGGPAGQWIIEAEVSATGSVTVHRLRKTVNAS